MTSRFVDTHCHFDLYADPASVLRESEQLCIYSIAVTNTPSVFPAMARLASGLKFVRAALGLHPELAIERAPELPLFAKHVATTRYVGEVGLDYKSAVTESDRAKQRSIFASILGHCRGAGGKVLTIHSRRAEADVIALLSEHTPGAFILHWYSGSAKNMRLAAEAGAYFSINNAMTMSERGRKLLQDIPHDRVLTESDGPFVRVDDQPARPIHTQLVVDVLGRTWRVERDEAADIVMKNFRRLLGGGAA